MQTFLPYRDVFKCAEVLDTKRLGKQRVEAIQIARTLLGISDGWKHHPAVKMWKGYESFLVLQYLGAMLYEWNRRGYKSPKCNAHYKQLNKEVSHLKAGVSPQWLTPDFCRSHQSNLIRKDPKYYGSKFSGVPDNLPYVWPK